MNVLNLITRLLDLHIHYWSRWDVVKAFTADQSGSVRVIQQRHCTTCGKVQIHQQDAS